MTPPDFLKVWPADIGRVGALGACILALVRYVTALPGESDRRRVVDGETWWRGSQDDIGQLLGDLHRKSVGRALVRLEAAGELLSRPSEDYGDRAKLYRAPDQPLDGSGQWPDQPLDDSGQSTGRKWPLPLDGSGQSDWPEVANLPISEELEEEEKKKSPPAEPEPLDAEAVPDPDNAHPSQTVNDNGNSDATSPPSPYCARHPQGTTANCARCGAAREKREAWDREHAARIDAERAAIRAEIRACPECDQNGFTEPDDGPTRRCTQHRQLADLPAVRKAS